MPQTIISKIGRIIAAFRPPSRRQVAALCWRQGQDGREILLITTRRTKRWTPPKGHLMADKTPAEAAETEAWEEAGARGEIADAPIGSYEYMKFLKSGKWERMAVDVYALKVEEMAGVFPEAGERELRWVPQNTAPGMVNERALGRLIRSFSPPN